jgi:hypothetical protein
MGRKPKRVLKLNMAFDEALERFLQVDPLEMPEGPERTRNSRAKVRKKLPQKKTEAGAKRSKIRRGSAAHSMKRD